MFVWVINFEVKLGILQSQLMAMITLVCLLAIVVFCYVCCSCVLFCVFVVGVVAPQLTMRTMWDLGVAEEGHTLSFWKKNLKKFIFSDFGEFYTIFDGFDPWTLAFSLYMSEICMLDLCPNRVILDPSPNPNSTL